MSLASICDNLEEGVYRFEAGRGWVRADGEPGLAGRPMVIVFVNIYCRHACREVMETVESRVGDLVRCGRLDVWLVVCTRFRRLCWHEGARRLFAVYKVYGSPTVLAVDPDGFVVGSLKGPLMVSRGLAGVLEELRARIEGGGNPYPPPATHP
jgi:hypothetical protein